MVPVYAVTLPGCCLGTNGFLHRSGREANCSLAPRSSCYIPEKGLQVELLGAIWSWFLSVPFPFGLQIVLSRLFFFFNNVYKAY